MTSFTARRTLPVAVAAAVAGLLAGSLLAGGLEHTDDAGRYTQSLRRDALPPATTGQVSAWAVRDASTRTPARRVVAQSAPRAGNRTPLRVVTVASDRGRPQVRVERTRGRSAAVASVADAQRSPDVLAVTVDTRVRVAGGDPWRRLQWPLDRLNAERVWATASGAGTVVAVVDTGVDATHPDLAGRVTDTGADFVTGHGDGTIDPHSHGTHVAGVIAAVKGNGTGVAGLAPTARIMPVRVLDGDGVGWNSDIAQGVIHATDHGADVINLSLGGPAADPATEAAVAYAVDNGVVVVAAAGNERQQGNPVTYPAAYPGVVAVAATEPDDAAAEYSNTGSYVDLAAPGSRVLSTVPGGYSYRSGTSMATPHVAAAAALAVDATDGALTPEQFERAASAAALDLGRPGRDDTFGHGLLAPGPLLCAVTGCDRADDPAEDPAEDPTGSPGTDPVEDGLGQVRVTPQVYFVAGGGWVHPGQRRRLVVGARDAYTGQPLPDLRVRVLGRSGGKVRTRLTVRTGEHGRATATVRIDRSTRFTLRAPATATSHPARSAHPIRWRAVPRVWARYGRRDATVTVVDNRRQRVVFQRATGNRWRPVRSVRASRRGVAHVRLRRGLYRARVLPRRGLSAVTTGSWSLR